MKTKWNNLLFFSSLLVLAVLVCWLVFQNDITHRQSSIRQVSQPTPENQNSAHATSTGSFQQKTTTVQSVFVQTNLAGAPLEERKGAAAHNVLQQNKPVDFWGEILDQNDKPISDVQVTLQVRHWHYNPPSDLNSDFPQFKLASDANGKFKLTDVTGDVLELEAMAKDGYRLSPKIPHSLGTSGGSFEHPTIFRMWKLGETANLVSHRTLFGFQPDGRVYTLNLIADQKTASGSVNGDLRVQFQRQSVLEPKEEYRWTLEISAVEGGLMETTDEFEYLAPENGYQPQILFQTNSIAPRSMPDLTKDYYFNSRNGQVYGVLHLQIFSDYNGQGAILVDSRINPNSSRNLQP